MTAGPEALAIVIGRAGSKGLPGKNAISLCGRPMIAFTIEDALEAETIGRIVVSTDSEVIARAARAGHVEVVERPAALATDTATVDSAVRHAVEATGDTSPVIVILYANVPVRPPGLIDRAVRRLAATGADSVQSYCDVGKHHPGWMVRLDDADRVRSYEANTVYRRQDLPALLIPDGGVIAVTRASLFTVIDGAPHAFLGSDRRGIVNPHGAVVDVDDATDLLVAEALLARTPVETVPR